MTHPALEMSGVRKVYSVGDTEVVALDHATLTVGSDEIVALVGPSGSGKTTLCSIAGGILGADRGRGRRRRRGHPRLQRQAAHRRSARSKVGFVFQSVNLVPFLTARENLLVVDELGRRERQAGARPRRPAARRARARRSVEEPPVAAVGRPEASEWRSADR